MRTELDFSNGNNVALSLRTLAELCRRGDALVVWVETDEKAAQLTIVLTMREMPKIKGGP